MQTTCVITIKLSRLTSDCLKVKVKVSRISDISTAASQSLWHLGVEDLGNECWRVESLQLQGRLRKLQEGSLLQVELVLLLLHLPLLRPATSSLQLSLQHFGYKPTKRQAWLQDHLADDCCPLLATSSEIHKGQIGRQGGLPFCCLPPGWSLTLGLPRRRRPGSQETGSLGPSASPYHLSHPHSHCLSQGRVDQRSLVENLKGRWVSRTGSSCQGRWEAPASPPALGTCSGY